MKFSRIVLLVSASTLATFGACAPRPGSDCEASRTCASPGDGDLGGSPGDGGNAGDGDGGTGGTNDPCDECDGDTPACNDAEECVECTADDSAACSGETPLCDGATETCVECLENSGCTGADASFCDEGSCAGCTQDDDCTHIANLNACDADSSTCVECTDSSDCGGNPCNPVTHTCSDFGTDRLTCETCDADENCAETDNFCVPMQYDGMDRPGGYCLKTAPSCSPPYMTLAAGRTSLSGVAGQNYCGVNEALATCEAVRALIDGVSCPGGNASECPESGLCQDIGGTATDRCTYKCTGVDDCKASGAGSTCGSAPDNNFCGYVP